MTIPMYISREVAQTMEAVVPRVVIAVAPSQGANRGGRAQGNVALLNE